MYGEKAGNRNTISWLIIVMQYSSNVWPMAVAVSAILNERRLSGIINPLWLAMCNNVIYDWRGWLKVTMSAGL